MDEIEVELSAAAGDAPSAAPAPKIDGRSRSNPINGAKAGRPEGTAWAVSNPEETEALIEKAATTLLAGRTPRHSPFLGPVTEEDRRRLSRLAGIPSEEFEARLTARLKQLADRTMDRVEEKLESDSYKPEGLSFLLTVLIDKLDRREGRASLAGATVNVQVNNYAGPERTREQILEEIAGAQRAS